MALLDVSWNNYPGFRLIVPQDASGKAVAGAYPGHGPLPEDTLPSEKTVLRALHGLFENNMKAYREQSERISCNLLKENSKARCEVEKGCSETPSPCLLYWVMDTAVLVSFSNVIM